MIFSRQFKVWPFSTYFSSLLERKTKFIKFWSKFWIKQVRFLQLRCSSLLQRSKPVQRNWLRFSKNLKKQCAFEGLMRLQLLRETFSLTIFLHQKITENRKMTKGRSLKTTRRLFTWILTPRRPMPHIRGLSGLFQSNHFLTPSCELQNVTLGPLNCQLNFG